MLAAYDHWLSWGRHEAAPRHDPVPRARPSVISEEKATFWSERGYIILEALISPGRCEAVNRRLGDLWDSRASGEPPVSIDIYIDREGARRIPFADAPDDARHLPYKLNDLVMHDELIASVALDERLCEGWIGARRPAGSNRIAEF